MLGVETAPTAVAPDPLMNSDLFEADDDDSDEEIFRSVKPKQKRSSTCNTHRLILSDEEDDESLPTLSDQGKPQSDVERESSVDFSKKDDTIEDENKNNINDSSDSDNENAKERKKIRRPVASSDDSDEESHPGNDNIDVDRSEKKIRRPVASSDDSDEESHPGNEDIDVDQSERKKKMHRSILSSDDSDGDSTSDEEEEEEEEEGEIAFQLTPPAEDPETETNGDKRSMRRKRISKEELQQIHSESQRIVRESTIRIPYHHPKPLSLDELFNKKPTLTATKLIGNRVPRINGKQLNTKEEMNSKKESKEENDELPDVLSSQAQETIVNDTSCVENSESSSKEISSEDKTDEIKLDKDTVVPELETIEDELQKDNANSAESETNNSVKADVECISIPTSSSTKPNELSPPKTSNVSKEDQLSSKISEQTSKEDQIPMFKTPPPATTPRHDPQSSQARRMKLLQDSLNRLKGVQPKLSGGPKITIDLDDDVEPSAEEKGVAKLMKRFVKHTKPVHKIHQKDVQISIVTKEKGEDGKEDLKHHTLTVGLDSKPDKIDPRLNIPGAKLCRLKENLQATMRVKREQERLKRQEVFKLDNEEGFEDEDEAELTEGSDTEDEEEGERDHGNVDEDADEDADYEPGNEFLDDEAESDDDDDEVDDEMDDEDEEEKSTVVKKLKKKSRSLEKESGLIDSDDEISPSRKKGNKKRAMVVDDVDEGGGEEKGITLRLDSTGTDDTDTEISDALQDSGRFNSIRTPRSISALDQCSKTMEMFDSATNSTVNSDFQVPISKVDTSSKKVSWNASKDSDSSKDGMSFVLPAPVRQDSSSNSLDTSFDTISLIPAHQPDGGTRRSGRTSIDSTKSDTFTPFSKHQSVLSNISSKTTSRNELTLPVEDSQDLFCEDSPRLPTITDSQQAVESQSFHFSFEDETQTQFLDENGLLNLKPSSSSNKKKTIFENTQAPNTESQSSMEELLGLCSGQFTATQGQDEVKSQKPGPFSQVSQRSGTQANMDELLNLCSGTFTEIDPKSEITSTRKIDENDDKDDDNGFEIASDPDGPDSDDDEIKHGLSSDEEDIAPKKRRRIIQQDSDDDDEEEEDDGKERKEEDSDLDSEFDLEINREGFKGKTYGKKLDIAKFVEEEAELSGSEFDSDENYDAEDEPDDEDIEGIVNEEMGDEDELRNQVNKVHLKTMDDDDARRLRIFKEMYLPDGDLHSDNKGRTRKFRWRHVDSQMDMFRPGSDGEEDEEEANDQDTQWRLLRHDREQWLKENEGKAGPVTPSIDEDSQFAKCLKAATVKKPQETKTQDVGEKEKEKDKKVGTPKPLKIMSTRGSFLSRSKNDLAKMASMLKPIANPQGPRSSRGFVFQSAEASLGEDSQTEPPPKVKRSASVSGPSTTPSGPQPKKPRLERSQSHFTSNSVFRHF